MPVTRPGPPGRCTTRAWPTPSTITTSSTTNLELPEPDPARGASTTLINEPALLAMTDALNVRVGDAVAAGRFPFVYGGDCSTLLGIVTGLRDHVGDVGLVFIDGHEDTMPLDVSEDGEAANTEIGLLLGLTGRLLTGGLGDRLPALRPEQLIVLGPRDHAWRRQFNVGTLADYGVWLAPLAEVADDPAGAGRGAVEQLAGHVGRWWLHIDLDVLDPVEFGAQGLPDVVDEPGGLTWDQLTDLVVSLFGSRRTASAPAWRSTIRTRITTAPMRRRSSTFVRNVVGPHDNKPLTQETSGRRTHRRILHHDHLGDVRVCARHDDDEPVRDGSLLTARVCLELFDVALGSRHLDLAARWLRSQGKGYYTIGSSGHEGNAAVAAALRPTDPALLHYRSGGFFLARAAQVGGRDALRDVLLGLRRGHRGTDLRRTAQGVRPPRPEHHSADVDHRVAPAAGGRRRVLHRARQEARRRHAHGPRTR